MTRTLRGLPAWSLTMTAFLSGITAPLGSAAQGQEIPFDEADVFAELNDTDGDLGFHALIDGEAWDRLVSGIRTGAPSCRSGRPAAWGSRA